MEGVGHSGPFLKLYNAQALGHEGVEVTPLCPESPHFVSSIALALRKPWLSLQSWGSSSLDGWEIRQVCFASWLGVELRQGFFLFLFFATRRKPNWIKSKIGIYSGSDEHEGDGTNERVRVRDQLAKSNHSANLCIVKPWGWSHFQGLCPAAMCRYSSQIQALWVKNSRVSQSLMGRARHIH